MTTRRKPEIDPKAAPCTNQDDELRKAMQTLRQPKSKPTPASAVAKAAPKTKKAKTKSVKPVCLDSEISNEKFSLKGELSLMEMRFIELYLSGQLTIDKAMESAGYVGYHPNSLYRLGRKIVQKYESLAEDHRKIFRSIGAGEVAVAEGLLNLAQNAKSEMVRLNAWATIAKCLGLQKEVVDVQHGMNIIIKSRSQSPPEPVPGGGRPALIHQVTPKTQPKMVSIIE